MSTVIKPRQMYTRHWGLIAISIITSVVTALGTVNHNLPAFSTYAETTAIPDIITILDFVLARIKDGKGINLEDAINLISVARDLVSKVPKVDTTSTTTPSTPSPTG